MAKDVKKGKSKYQKRLQLRKKLSRNRGYTSTNRGQPKKLPLPLPILKAMGEV